MCRPSPAETTNAISAAGSSTGPALIADLPSSDCSYRDSYAMAAQAAADISAPATRSDYL